MSRQIKIGKLTLGGGALVRVQSMTNTDTTKQWHHGKGTGNKC